jgi:catalase
VLEVLVEHPHVGADAVARMARARLGNVPIFFIRDPLKFQHFIRDVSGHLKGGVSEPILARAFEYWRNIDKQIGDKIETAVRNGT